MSNRKEKSFGKIFIAIIAFICLSLDCWYAYIHFFGKEKTVSTSITFSDMEVQKLDTISGEIETETKTFLEVNLFDNCVEIKFNQLYDENQSAFYSHGIQLMVKDGVEKDLSSEDIFDGTYNKSLYSELVKNDKLVYEGTHYLQRCKIFYDIYNKVVSDKHYNYIDLYEYQSFDDYETPLQSTFLQDGDSSFKLQTKDGGENKIFALKFKNYDSKITLDDSGLAIDLEKRLDTTNLVNIGTELIFNHQENPTFELHHYYDEITYYRALDIYYFIESLANSVEGLAPGFIGETYLRMPDIFKVLKYDESSQQYIDVGSLEDWSGKVTAENISYTKIKLTVYEGDITKSSQSMFNRYRGYQNYNENPDEIDMTDYLTGKSIITATLEDLNWKLIGTDNLYTFSLSKEFKSRWIEYKNTIYIKVIIDSTYLEENYLKYYNFEIDDDFFIYQILTSDGKSLYQGVNYVWFNIWNINSTACF